MCVGVDVKRLSFSEWERCLIVIWECMEFFVLLSCGEKLVVVFLLGVIVMMFLVILDLVGRLILNS